MRRTVRSLLLLLIIVLMSPLAANAHGYYRGGIWIDPWWIAPYPYYSASPVVIQQPATEYYIQPVPQKLQEPAYWYYCRNPEGYYPAVKQCLDGWMKVVPTPPNPRENKGGMPQQDNVPR